MKTIQVRVKDLNSFISLIWTYYTGKNQQGGSILCFCPEAFLGAGDRTNPVIAERVDGFLNGRSFLNRGCRDVSNNTCFDTEKNVKACWKEFLSNISNNNEFKAFDDIFDYKKIINETLK